MTKRLLQIIPTLDRSGAEKQLALLATGLPRDEFDVHVCVLTRSGPLLEMLERADVSTVVLGKRWKVDPGAYLRLKRHIAKLAPDLVQTWLFAANSYGRAAALACGVKRIIASERCVDLWKGWPHLAIDRYLAARTQAIVVNSTGVRDFYVRKRLPAELFEVIPNGTPPAEPSPRTREDLFAELELPPNAKLVGLVARLWPQKRVKDAIWAADLLTVIRDDFHLLIIGDGPQYAELLRYRDKCQMAEHVHFLGERNDVSSLMPHFDLLWSTSAYEGLSNTIMEAMAAGVPVLASDIPGNADLVVHEETGWLIPTFGADFRRRRAAFARQTNLVLDQPALLRRIGDAARHRMATEFSVERMIERYTRLYRRLLGD